MAATRISSRNLIIIFAENVRRLRHTLEISQEELAERAKLHRTYIGSIERGERNVSLENIEKIAKALKSKPPTLLEDNSEGRK